MSNTKTQLPEGFTPWHFTGRSGPAGTTDDIVVEVVLRGGIRKWARVVDFDWGDDDDPMDIIGWRVADKVAPAEDAHPHAHPHAHLMLEYAKDAMTRPDPWLLWQRRSNPQAPWEDLETNPVWDFAHQYRHKPVRIPTRVINGFEVPAPVREQLAMKTDYFIATPEDLSWYCLCEWGDDKDDWAWLERGMVFLNEDHAIANAKAMCGIDPEWAQKNL